MSARAFRASAAEKLLEAGGSVAEAAKLVGEGQEANSDLYASADYRRHLAQVHAARALNISVTAALYLVCCAILGGMLALDTVAVALAVSLTLVFVLWLIMLRHLVRGVVAANRGEPFEVPSWLCATIVS